MHGFNSSLLRSKTVLVVLCEDFESLHFGRLRLNRGAGLSCEDSLLQVVFQFAFFLAVDQISR